MRASTVGAVLRNALAWTCSLVMIIPLFLMLVNSFKSQYQANLLSIALPTSLRWSNYWQVIQEGNLVTSFLNSVLYAGGSTVIGLLFTSMAAFVLARNPTRWNRIVYFVVIMGIAIPINYVTLMKVMIFTHMINTRFGITVLFAATQVPFNLFLMHGFFKSVPRELDEAAIIDGCGPFRLFFSVIFPLLKPITVTTGILSFIGVWNQFLFPLYYLNSSDKWPMTLAVYNFFGQYQQQWQLVSADIVLTILPVILLYLLGQRFIISGLASGAVKG